MPTTPPPDYHRKRWAAITIWIVLFTAAGAYGFLRLDDITARNRQLAMQGEGAHDAICVLRADLESRVHASEEFLRDHPTGFLGIPAAVILNSFEGQRRTIRALSTLNCKPKGAP